MSERVKCAIRGCQRTTGRDVGEWVCGEHWRAGVPPRSPQRRVWLRFRRIVRKYGWTNERANRQDRIWAWLKARCQSAADGDLDQRAIDRMFGWDQ